MALCDRLEAARASREAVRDRLAAASLARLNAPDPETFHADARFALDALPALTTRPDQIKQLRQTILNLGVRGKLVPQDMKGETVLEAGVPGIGWIIESRFENGDDWFNPSNVAAIENKRSGVTPYRNADIRRQSAYCEIRHWPSARRCPPAG